MARLVMHEDSRQANKRLRWGPCACTPRQTSSTKTELFHVSHENPYSFSYTHVHQNPVWSIARRRNLQLAKLKRLNGLMVLMGNSNSGRTSQPLRASAGGFTLMELMIVIVLVALMATLGVPAYRTQVLNSQMTSASNDLLATINSARNEAVSRQNFVSVCPRNTAGTACAAVGWEAGWILFEDDDADGVVDNTDTVLFTQAPLGVDMTARGTSQITNSITFRPNGTSDLTATQTLMICDSRGYGENARGIIITVVGHSSGLAANESGQASCTP